MPFLQPTNILTKIEILPTVLDKINLTHECMENFTGLSGIHINCPKTSENMKR